MVTTACGIGSADGMNEKGVALHLLYLTATDFVARDASKKGVQAGLRDQYIPALSKPSSTVPVPGNGNAADRFQCEACFLGNLPDPVNKREAASGILFIPRNVSVLFGRSFRGVWTLQHGVP